MFKKQNRWYADWRDKKGTRRRKAFESQEEAVEYETGQKQVTRQKKKGMAQRLSVEVSMTTLTISLPEPLKEFIDAEVRTKGYGNVSEYVRGLLRAAQAKDADMRLEALLFEGLASGEDKVLTPDFWRELKTYAAQILARKLRATAKYRGPSLRSG